MTLLCGWGSRATLEAASIALCPPLKVSASRAILAHMLNAPYQL